MTFNLSNPPEIRSHIYNRDITFFLVTEEELKNISAKNYLSDFFLWIASVSFSGFIAIVLFDLTSPSMAPPSLKMLHVIRGFCLFLAFLFTVLWAIFVHFYRQDIQNIKKSSWKPPK